MVEHVLHKHIIVGCHDRTFHALQRCKDYIPSYSKPFLQVMTCSALNQGRRPVEAQVLAI